MTFKYEQISDEDWEVYIKPYEDRDPSSPGHRWWTVNEDKSCFLRKIRSLAGPEPSSEVFWHFYYDNTHYKILVDILNVERKENWRRVKLKVVKFTPLDLSIEKYNSHIAITPSDIQKQTLLNAFHGYRFGVDPAIEFYCEYELIY